MKILIACEYSGVEREAFAALGHDVLSCDLLPTDRPGNHYQGDVRDLLYLDWDLMIAHPPCTDLAVSGNAWMGKKWADGRVDASLDFVRTLMNAPIPRIAIENPKSIISSQIRPADQTVQPWQFGHGEQKATCYWLKNLPKLVPTNIVPGREQRVWKMGPSPDRWKLRSTSYEGIAAAMADQWTRPYQMQMELF